MKKQVKNNYYANSKDKAFFILLAMGFLVSFGFAIMLDNPYLLILSYLLNTFIVISTAHQAVHNAFFSSKKLNKLVSKISFIMMGVDPDLWIQRHIKDHHVHPNTKGHEPSLDHSLLLRLSPYTEKRSYHKYQHLYAPIVFTFGGLFLVFVQDFVNYLNSPSTKSFMEFSLYKLIWVLFWIFIPMIFINTTPANLLLISVISTGISIWAFLPIGASHLFEETNYFIKKGESKFKNRQIETTIDFAINSSAVTYFYGGLNHHRAHHLYPRAASSHLAKFTKEIYKKYDLSCDLSFLDIYLEHFKLLKKLGK